MDEALTGEASIKGAEAMGKQAQRPPELYRIILPVKDIKKASIFYSKLLDLKGKKVSPGRVYFECGQTILACYDPVADGDSMHTGWNLHPKQYIYFSVADLDSTFEKAKNLRCKRIDNRKAPSFLLLLLYRLARGTRRSLRHRVRSYIPIGVGRVWLSLRGLELGLQASRVSGLRREELQCDL
jgi:hypothetical protein